MPVLHEEKPVPRFKWNEAGIDTSKTDEVDLACQMQAWKAFVCDGPTL